MILENLFQGQEWKWYVSPCDSREVQKQLATSHSGLLCMCRIAGWESPSVEAIAWHF